MRTSATNRKIHELVTALKKGSLIPNPDFQRRLVWANKHKVAFLETVTGGFPFPEIYIAAGELDSETGESKTLLVDGQQRITTLLQYFNDSAEIRLPKHIPRYADLMEAQKIEFLEYEVVVRDLGKKSKDEIIQIFKKINSTNYALNAIEIHHAIYDGPFMKFAEEIAQHEFFDAHRVFSATQLKRSRDVSFTLVVIISMMSGYFNLDTELEGYLQRYNEDFEEGERLKREIYQVIAFIQKCDLGEKCRAWQIADLLTLLVELHRFLFKEKKSLDSTETRNILLDFYGKVDKFVDSRDQNINVQNYYSAVIQGSNQRAKRIARGKILRAIIESNSIPDVDVQID